MPPDTPIIRPNEQRLLQAYFDARCDIFLLAQREKLPVLDLLRWSRSPAVQAHIAELKKLTEDSIHLRTAQARLLSLDTLETIVKTTDDPIELRRAASTLFRGGATMPQPRPPRPTAHDPFSGNPTTTVPCSKLPPPPPAGEVAESSRPEGVPSLRSPPTHRNPTASPKVPRRPP